MCSEILFYIPIVNEHYVLRTLTGYNSPIKVYNNNKDEVRKECV